MNAPDRPASLCDPARPARRAGPRALALVAVLATAAGAFAVLSRRGPPPEPARARGGEPADQDPVAGAPPTPAPGVVPPATPTPGLASASALAGLDLGTFRLAPRPVADADTIRLAEPKENVRVLAVDAEEAFYDLEARARARLDFAAYARAEQGTARRPRKYATPAGDAAKAFAEAWFRGITTVRLEVEEAGRDRDGFGRRLAHVLAQKDGEVRLYAEDLVRAGWSPYFTKYGRSRRYDARLRAAQDEAQRAKRGVWGDEVAHYPDYEARLAWWEARARQVDAWERDVEGPHPPEHPVRLGAPSETARLAALLGRRATVFGSLDRVVSDRGPPRLLLVDAPRTPFAVVVPDRQVFSALDLDAVEARFVRVTGVVAEYRGRVQLVLERPEDLSTR